MKGLIKFLFVGKIFFVPKWIWFFSFLVVLLGESIEPDACECLKSIRTPGISLSGTYGDFKATSNYDVVEKNIRCYEYFDNKFGYSYDDRSGPPYDSDGRSLSRLNYERLIEEECSK